MLIQKEESKTKKIFNSFIFFFEVFIIVITSAAVFIYLSPVNVMDNNILSYFYLGFSFGIGLFFIYIKQRKNKEQSSSILISGAIALIISFLIVAILPAIIELLYNPLPRWF